MRINDLLNAFLHLQQLSSRETVAAVFPSLATAGGRFAPSTADAPEEQAAAASGDVSGRQLAVTVPIANSIRVPGHAAASQESSPALGVPQRIDHPAGQLPAELLVGDAYYAAKDQLIHHEQVWPAADGSCVRTGGSSRVRALRSLCLQVLLRWLGFELCVDHPYRYLLNFANVMRCSES